jgi:hypothetical protein
MIWLMPKEQAKKKTWLREALFLESEPKIKRAVHIERPF